MKALKNQSGFTLVEMLIVVIVLGILAMIVVPQVAVSTDDTKLKALQTNLSSMRSAIELYYAQHNQTYPGAKKDTDGTAVTTAGEAATAFLKQLTQYTDASGRVSATKDTTYKYGPYIKGGQLPANPMNNNSNVLCDIATTDITTRTQSGTESWKFYTNTGVLIANDGGTTDGTVHANL